MRYNQYMKTKTITKSDAIYMDALSNCYKPLKRNDQFGATPEQLFNSGTKILLKITTQWWHNSNIPMHILLDAGVDCLLNCSQKFDPEKGYFSTLVYTAIDNTIKNVNHKYNSVFKHKNIRDNTISIHSKNQDDTTLEDVLVDNTLPPDLILAQKEQNEYYTKIINESQKREEDRYIAKCYYVEGNTIITIANQLNVSRKVLSSKLQTVRDNLQRYIYLNPQLKEQIYDR